MKLGEIGGYDLPYFSKEKFLTKSHLIKQFTGDYELAKYLPDKVNPSTVTRSFLLALLFNIRKEKYVALYAGYKDKKRQFSTTRGKIYQVQVNQTYASKIKEFIPTSK